MNWQVGYLVGNMGHIQVDRTIDEAIDLACHLIGEGKQVLSIRDVKAQGSPIYGAEILRLCESRRL